MNTREKLIELVKDFDVAMLVTKTEGGTLDARPMVVAEASDGGELWFVTSRSSGKVADVAVDTEVVVTMQGKRKFASVTGNCRIVDDQDKIESLWNEMWRVWFPDGKDDQSIVLLRVKPSHGEYWDNTGLAGLKYLFDAGKAYLQGERPESDETVNASVAL